MHESAGVCICHRRWPGSQSRYWWLPLEACAAIEAEAARRDRNRDVLVAQLVPVVGIALQDDVAALDPLLQDEWAGSDGLSDLSSTFCRLHASRMDRVHGDAAVLGPRSTALNEERKRVATELGDEPPRRGGHFPPPGVAGALRAAAGAPAGCSIAGSQHRRLGVGGCGPRSGGNPDGLPRSIARRRRRSRDPRAVERVAR